MTASAFAEPLATRICPTVPGWASCSRNAGAIDRPPAAVVLAAAVAPEAISTAATAVTRMGFMVVLLALMGLAVRR